MGISSMLAWLQTPLSVGLLGAIPGFAALYYTRRVDVRERSRDQPVVSVKLRTASTPGWLNLEIYVRNVSDAAWVLEEVKFLNAPEVRAASDRSLLRQGGYGGQEPTAPTDENTALGSVRLDLDIAPRGTTQTFDRRGDERYEHVLLRCSSSRRRISIRISLRCMDSSARRIVMTAHRDIPMLDA